MGQSGNPLVALHGQGQSVWLDFIRRQALTSGEVAGLIRDDGLRGMTANPSIFDAAISKGGEYDEAITKLAKTGATPLSIYETLAVEDIQMACDQFRELYDREDGADGFVSLEVAPSLAHDTQGTLEEARRLWKWVDRPNLMIKIPGTEAGAPAIEQALFEGINVNVTLLFALRNYERVAWAYVGALERRATLGQPLGRIASVASFFVSRVDVLLDPQLEARAAVATDSAERAKLESLVGKIAIANAKLAYESFGKIFGSARFAALKAKGARVQRPLWASTSVKNPKYPDLLYADALIGPDTVDTLPRETVDAFRDHGNVARTVDQDYAGCHAALKTLADLGFDYDAMTKQLEDEGVVKFQQSFDQLLASIEKKAGSMAGTRA
ncbi:MAG: transaldolase [Chloroflexota bacterium]